MTYNRRKFFSLKDFRQRYMTVGFSTVFDIVQKFGVST